MKTLKDSLKILSLLCFFFMFSETKLLFSQECSCLQDYCIENGTAAQFEMPPAYVYNVFNETSLFNISIGGYLVFNDSNNYVIGGVIDQNIPPMNKTPVIYQSTSDFLINYTCIINWSKIYEKSCDELGLTSHKCVCGDEGNEYIRSRVCVLGSAIYTCNSNPKDIACEEGESPYSHCVYSGELYENNSVIEINYSLKRTVSLGTSPLPFEYMYATEDTPIYRGNYSIFERGGVIYVNYSEERKIPIICHNGIWYGTCGNNICEDWENPGNCPEDCCKNCRFVRTGELTQYCIGYGGCQMPPECLYKDIVCLSKILAVHLDDVIYEEKKRYLFACSSRTLINCSESIAEKVVEYFFQSSPYTGTIKESVIKVFKGLSKGVCEDNAGCILDEWRDPDLMKEVCEEDFLADWIEQSYTPLTNYSQWREHKSFPFNFAREVNVTLNSHEPIYDVVISFSFNSKELISKGKMRNDCGDIRIVDDSFNYLPYYIDQNTCNTTNTIVYVKVPILKPGSNHLWLLYGNPSITSASNPSAVFMFFQDFEDEQESKQQLTFYRWAGDASKECVISGGYLYLATNSGEGGCIAFLKENINPANKIISFSFKQETTKESQPIVALFLDKEEEKYKNLGYCSAEFSGAGMACPNPSSSLSECQYVRGYGIGAGETIYLFLPPNMTIGNLKVEFVPHHIEKNQWHELIAKTWRNRFEVYLDGELVLKVTGIKWFGLRKIAIGGSKIEEGKILIDNIKIEKNIGANISTTLGSEIALNPLFSIGANEGVFLNSSESSVGSSYLFYTIPSELIKKGKVDIKWKLICSGMCKGIKAEAYIIKEVLNRKNDGSFPEKSDLPYGKVKLGSFPTYSVGKEVVSSFFVPLESYPTYITLLVALEDKNPKEGAALLIDFIKVRNYITTFLMNFTKAQVVLERSGTVGDYGKVRFKAISKKEFCCGDDFGEFSLIERYMDYFGPLSSQRKVCSSSPFFCIITLEDGLNLIYPEGSRIKIKANTNSSDCNISKVFELAKLVLINSSYYEELNDTYTRCQGTVNYTVYDYESNKEYDLKDEITVRVGGESYTSDLFSSLFFPGNYTCNDGVWINEEINVTTLQLPIKFSFGILEWFNISNPGEFTEEYYKKFIYRSEEVKRWT